MARHPQSVHQQTVPRQAAGSPRRSAGRARSQPEIRAKTKTVRVSRDWWLILPATGLLLVAMLVSSVIVLHLVYSSRILPHVYAGNIAIGGLTQQAAADTLNQQWQTLTLRDGDRTWQINPVQFGLLLDADRTAREALNTNNWRGLVQRVNVAPVVGVDVPALRDELERVAPLVEQMPINAGVAFDNGAVIATPAQYGRVLDINATAARVESAPQSVLAEGEFLLTMQDVAPAVTDAAPLVDEARQLLSQTLAIRLFDPVTGDSVAWSAPPQEWAKWLTATPDSQRATGLSLTADASRVRDFLAAQVNTQFDASRTLDLDTAITQVQQAISAGRITDIVLTVQHQPRAYTVQAGDSITGIAWRFGIPYPYIQQANGGINGVSIGQQITIPAADSFLLYEPVPNKRIVVDLSEQMTRVYENGALKWEWLSSTGIDDSPTWPGIYQVISHEPNAYAGNWNLWMPNFIGVYQPVPGANFTNGFHGFPTRGGGRLLWQNDLGRRVTYGCILLSDANVQLLYNWAETGVVVEIRQ